MGGRVERLRGLTGLSARELDALAGLRAGHTRLIETGHVQPDNVQVRTVKQIAAVFGVTLDWLTEGDGPSPANDDVRTSVARAQRRAGRQKTGTAD